MNSIVEFIRNGSYIGAISVAVMLLLEYSRPEIAYYRLESRGDGLSGMTTVRIYLVNFERIPVDRPFGVAIWHRTGLRQSEFAATLYAGPWFREEMVEATSKHLKIVFDGMPAGGVFLIELSLPEDEAEDLMFDHLDPTVEDENSFRSVPNPLRGMRGQMVVPRGFRKLETVAPAASSTRFQVQLLSGAAMASAMFFAVTEVVRRVWSIHVDLSSVGVAVVATAVPALAVGVFALPGQIGEGRVIVSQEFACAYKKPKMIGAGASNEPDCRRRVECVSAFATR